MARFRKGSRRRGWIRPKRLPLGAPSAGNVVVGQATETDTALSVTPVAGALSGAVGLATETDTGLSSTPVAGELTGAVGLATETDTALDSTPVAGELTGAVGQSSETDTGLSVTPSGDGDNVAVGLATETDTALSVTPVAGELTGAVGQATETDTAFSIATLGVVDVGIATETDTALGVTPSGVLAGAVNTATETDTALAVDIDATYVIGQAVETDTARPVTSESEATIAVGQAVETDTAQTVVPGVSTIDVNFAFEADVALPVVPASVPVGVATEKDTALGIEINNVVPEEDILNIDDWVNSPPEWGQYGQKVNEWMHDLSAVVRQVKSFIERPGALIWSNTYEVDLSGVTNTTLVPLPMVLGNGDHAPRFGFDTTMIVEASGLHGVNTVADADVLWSIKDSYDTTSQEVTGNNLSVWTGEYHSLGSQSEWTPFHLIGGKELASGEQGKWSAGFAITSGFYSNLSIWKVSIYRGHILPGSTSFQLPPVTSHQVDFRTVFDPSNKTPDTVLEALGYTGSVPITRAQLDGILDDWVTGTGGTTRNVTSTATWNTAMANAVPGDLVRVTTGFDPAGGLDARGDLYGLSGTTLTTSPDGGDPGLPIIVTCADGEYVDENDTATLAQPGLDLMNCRHVWAVGFNVSNSPFGIRAMNWGGSASYPAYIAYCDVDTTGDAAYAIQGWFQTIASSGGTPPAGAGNEYGFSEHFVIEHNTASDPGQRTDHVGECFYFGRGATPGYVSYAKDGYLRHNVMRRPTADFVDIKAGSHRIRMLDNDGEGGYLTDGAGIMALYVVTAFDDRPSWYDFDPEIYIEGNRLRDMNLTTTGPSSSDYAIQTSLCGIRAANNIIWGMDNGAVGFRLRSEKPAGQSQSSDGEVWTIVNNLFWLDTGVANVGAPATSPVAFTAGLIDARNNIGPTGASGVEHTATSSDFIDSAAIPTVDTVDQDATWETYGAGSAFDLDPASALVGAGVSITDLSLTINQDISQRSIPSSSTNPGPFQQHPANA